MRPYFNLKRGRAEKQLWVYLNSGFQSVATGKEKSSIGWTKADLIIILLNVKQIQLTC